MQALEKNQTKAAALARELATIQAALIAARAALDEAAGNNAANAAERASAVIVLEARERSTQKAIETNDKSREQIAETLKSKEYKEGKKKIAELRARLSQEADEVFQEFVILRERVTADMERYDELKTLVNRYGLDLSDRDVTQITYGRDFQYLQRIDILLTEQKKIDDIAEANRTQRARMDAEAKQPKHIPAPWTSNKENPARFRTVYIGQ